MSDRRKHWQTVYETKPTDQVSWYQPLPSPSLDALARLQATPNRSLIDIGGGASSLAAELLRAGWSDLAVLDISDAALSHARAALGADAGNVDWICANITAWHPKRTFDIWHDRAVFHFLTEHAERAVYKSALLDGLAQGGLMLIATFAKDGPEKCSGLPVRQYGADDLTQEFGASLSLIESWRETHLTPSGAAQAFTWCAFRKETT
ncbi:class I SAM-dependent methyltransferase [Qipengyuania sp. ASV99]|uniref:class I SAM-dependent methyltransferase n=1 Tax=Qipengyuania sp. ASV99 TaxID=3399681 RepID=UPI003A4C5FCE